MRINANKHSTSWYGWNGTIHKGSWRGLFMDNSYNDLGRLRIFMWFNREPYGTCIQMDGILSCTEYSRIKDLVQKIKNKYKSIDIFMDKEFRTESGYCGFIFFITGELNALYEYFDELKVYLDIDKFTIDPKDAVKYYLENFLFHD